ncbi:MAG: hypothetical protein HYY06_10330 [Deltaproteobacteria bacterium]|nr:hypothetical protein [Deltaproteobacteria bacterium]
MGAPPTQTAGTTGTASTDAYAQALLHALARDEAAGRRPPRLTEPGQATWQRFCGRLGSGDFLRLLAEDAAVVHPIPFDTIRLSTELSLDLVPDQLVDDWLAALPSLDLTKSATDYIGDQARLLGVTTQLARSELQQVKRHQRVLELPGTGGQLAHHLVATQPELSLQGNCVVACDGWRQLTLAGIVGLDLGAPNSDYVVAASAAALREDRHPLRQQRFDFVVGLRPDKGGELQVEDELALWFHGARIVLV